MAGQPTPPSPKGTPGQFDKGLVAGLIKGNQWLIGPDLKAAAISGGGGRVRHIHQLREGLFGKKRRFSR